jgi:hypothetical protein
MALRQMIALGRASPVLPESLRAQLGGDLAAVLLDAPTVTTVIACRPTAVPEPSPGLVQAAPTFSKRSDGVDVTGRGLHIRR